MRARLARFRRDDDGAITVDWVVLTAFCVGLGIIIYLFLRNGFISAETGLIPRIAALITSAS